MGHAIFISYRRDDTEGEAGRLYDDLARAFGDSCVFMDVAGISPGVDFRKAIEDNVVSCGVLLAVIGPSWVSIHDPDGKRRLDDANDFVRLEISSALKRNVAVIPVLVHDATMPHPESVPDDLKDLCYRNGVELSHARWNSDVALLITALRAYVKSTVATEQHTVHATVPVQLPPPHPAPPVEPPAERRSMGPLLQGAAVAAVIVIASAIYFAVHNHRQETKRNDEMLLADSVPDSKEAAGAAAATAAPYKDEKEPGKEPDGKAGDGEQTGAERLVGRWMFPNPREGNSLSWLEISSAGDHLLVHAWGACQPTACDWGNEPAYFDGSAATAVFKFPVDNAQDGMERVATVKISPGLNGLDVQVQNTFSGNGETHSNQARLQFVPSH